MKQTRSIAAFTGVVAGVFAVVGCGGRPPPPAAPVTPAPVTSTVAPTDATPVAGPAARRIPTRSSEIAVVVEGAKITINGVAFPIEPKLTELEAVLGKPDRASDKINRIHTWDALGVIAYEPYDGRVTTVNFSFQPEEYEFSARSGFAGSFVVDGKPLDGRAEYATATTWPGTKHSTLGSASATSERGTFHVFVFAKAATAKLDGALLSFYNKPDGKPSLPAGEGMRITETACLAGEANKCTMVAIIYQAGGDDAKGFAFAKRGCDGGDALGCSTLGLMYGQGRGVAKSPAAAKQAYQRACKLGDRMGCSLAQ